MDQLVPTDYRVRGSATVSVMWLIVLLVLFVAAGGFVYVLAAERSTKDASIAQLNQEKERLQERNSELNERVLALSSEVGFRDPDSAEPFSRSQEIKDKLAALRTNYDFLGDDVTSLDTAVEGFMSETDSLYKKVSELESQVQSAEQARSAAESKMRTLETDKDTALAELQSKLDDERARAQSAEDRDSTQIDSLRKEVDDARARTRAAEDEATQKVAEAMASLRVSEARNTELVKKLEILRNPQEPDGEILATSNVNTCNIDLGRRNLLRRGTRFTAFRYDKNGAIKAKGMIEVRKVGETQSECGIIDTIDEFDPVSAGDLISAPLYDPDMQREFVLVGRFPAGYSKEAVKSRLTALGAKVADQVSPSTDFLIVGRQANLDDPDAEEDPAETEAFRLAGQYKVQTLPIAEILDYLKYD